MLGCATDVVHLKLDLPPEVVSTVPAADASSVALTQPITVLFSEPITSTTISDAITVSFGTNDVSGAVSVANSSLLFTPTGSYAYAAQHMARVAPTVRDLSGRDLVLSSAYLWTFTTRDLAFTSAQEISLSISEPTLPRVFAASSDHAVAVWHRHDGIRADIVASEYVSGDWTPQQTLDSTTADAIFPSVVIDGSGLITAAWGEDNGAGCFGIWSARNTGTGWNLPVQIDNATCGGGVVFLAANPSGVVIATWQASNGTVTNAWANRYIPGSGWEGAVLIEQEANSIQNVMDIALDDGGNAIVVFQAYDGTRYNVFASRLVPGTGWSVVPLETSTNNAQDAQIAMAADGYAVIVWEQAGGAVPDIAFATFTPGIGYSTAALVEGDESGPCSSPTVAISRTGDAIAVWERGTGGQIDIEAAFLPSRASAWEPSVKIESSSEAARRPKIAIDSRGFAVSTWHQFDGIRNSAWSARYSPTSGWESATVLEAEAGDVNLTGIDVSLAQDGYGFVVWSQTAGTEDRIRSNALR